MRRAPNIELEKIAVDMGTSITELKTEVELLVNFRKFHTFDEYKTALFEITKRTGLTEAQVMLKMLSVEPEIFNDSVASMKEPNV